MMGSSCTPIETLRDFVARRFGLLIDESKRDLMFEVASRRGQALGLAAESYVAALEDGRVAKEELQGLIQELTVTETYFFRHMEQLRAFSEVALPATLDRRANNRNLRFLSAGCASGEEPYSLSMLVRESLPDWSSWRISLKGMDVNAAALQRARTGRYSAWSLRETPLEMRERWFREEGKEFELDPSILRMVSFEERNLSTGEEVQSLGLAEEIDVVFCRNVIMYFTPEAATRLVASFARSLARGGFLFLGHAETLRGLSQDFHLEHSHGTFYYRRRDALRAALARPGHDPRPRRLVHAGVSEPVDVTGSWVEAIQEASDRVRRLTDLSRSGVPAPENTQSEGTRWDLAAATLSLQREQYAEGLDALCALPPESLRDPDVLLLRAVLLAHIGQLSVAESACRELLDRDDMNAGAHYLTALCREHAGDIPSAVEHDQLASHLDPSFAMPRLHQGLIARRSGDHRSARWDLGQALVLLQREDPLRLMLFGGGFSRASLIALCRSQLSACEVEP